LFLFNQPQIEYAFFFLIFRQDLQDYYVFLTADTRRRSQTFLPRDPRGKKHVNHCVIIFIHVPG